MKTPYEDTVSGSSSPVTGRSHPIADKNRFLALVDEADDAKRRLDQASSVYRSVLRRAKDSGFNTKEMVRAMSERKADPATREASKQAFLRYLKWLEEDR